MKNIQEILKKHLLWLRDEPNGERADLTGVDLTGEDLSGINLSSAILTGTNLSSTDLRSTNLSSTDLRSTNLSGADLRNADLSGTDLRKTDFRYADLRNTNLRNANLIGTDFSSANLIRVNLSQKFLQITGIGSEKRTTTYLFEYNIVFCGCFKGTLAQFEEQVMKTHSENPKYLKEYLGAIAYIKSLM